MVVVVVVLVMDPVVRRGRRRRTAIIQEAAQGRGDMGRIRGNGRRQNGLLHQFQQCHIVIVGVVIFLLYIVVVVCRITIVMIVANVRHGTGQIENAQCVACAAATAAVVVSAFVIASRRTLAIAHANPTTSAAADAGPNVECHVHVRRRGAQAMRHGFRDRLPIIRLLLLLVVVWTPVQTNQPQDGARHGWDRIQWGWWCSIGVLLCGSSRRNTGMGWQAQGQGKQFGGYW